MSTIPPSLLYLTIFNPTLQPTSPTSPGDEDAEEQAHILFYTARERAVSRDRMLRQVGLAKALINFSEMFSPEGICENVHSQSRRMVMISPEPGFWIHGCFELARTPRPTTVKGKSKDKGKAKKVEKLVQQEVVYDYHDSSLHDVVLRAHILQGYEDFKLTHGSLTSILSTLGQQALELQLERFFTVWAWKWDMDRDTDFASYLGVPLHPLSQHLTSILDDLAGDFPENTCIFALAPPYVIPSNSFSLSKFPTSLTRHILSRIPPTVSATGGISTTPSSDMGSTVDTIRASSSTHELASGISGDVKTTKVSAPSGTGTFMMMPSVSMGVDLRNMRWGWPGYLTFGKGASAKSTSVPHTPSSPPSMPSQLIPPEQEHKDEGVEGNTERPNIAESVHSSVDAESLREAMSTEYVRTPPTYVQSLAVSSVSEADSVGPLEPTHSQPNGQNTGVVAPTQDPISVISQRSFDADMVSSDFPVDNVASSPTVPETPASIQDHADSRALPSPAPALLRTTVHLDESAGSLKTQEKRVWHLTRDELTLALISGLEPPFEAGFFTRRGLEALSAIQGVINQRERMSDEDISIPSATRILQPQDLHVIAVDGYTTSSANKLINRSENLLNAQEMLRSDFNVSEVFSRGQNPQHWHVAKRGLSMSDDARLTEGEVYMEVARKESTLTDVDNALAAVVRNFVESIGEI